MTSLFANDCKPFNDVYIHGTVLDECSDKMSKSKGNGIDPLVMIQGGTQRYLGKDYTCAGYGNGGDATRRSRERASASGRSKAPVTKSLSGLNPIIPVRRAGVKPC
jgi:valyl-tRNA synthetase